jgi:hypothetical protein
MDTIRAETEISQGAVKAGPMDPRAAKILSRTMFKDMVGHGLSAQQILAVASELIALVTAELKQNHEGEERV